MSKTKRRWILGTNRIGGSHTLFPESTNTDALTANWVPYDTTTSVYEAIHDWVATAITGATGLQGQQGATGVVGANTGLQGVTGFQGQTGVYGLPGVQGITGLWGGTGIQGVTGLRGQTGIQGVTGLIGGTGIQGVTGLWGQTGIQSQTGLQGQTGTQGGTGIQGSTGLGLQGITGIQGSQGQTGIQGLTGIQGFQGGTGLLGATGLQGLTGIQGAQGQTGIQGNTGIQGWTGVQGGTGIQGNQGYTGIRGLPTSQIMFNNVSRYSADTSSGEEVWVVSSSSVYTELPWDRSGTTLNIYRNTHGHSVGNRVIVRNTNLDYQVATIDSTSSSSFSLTTLNVDGSSGGSAAYSLGFIYAHNTTGPSKTGGTLFAPTGDHSDAQLLALRIRTGGQASTYNLFVPASSVNGAGQNTNRGDCFVPDFNVRTDSDSLSAVAATMTTNISGSYSTFQFANLGSLSRIIVAHF